MPISLLMIPEEIQILIVAKLDLGEYLNFYQCSRISNSIVRRKMLRIENDYAGTGTWKVKSNKKFFNSLWCFTTAATSTNVHYVGIRYNTNYCKIPLRSFDSIPLRLVFQNLTIQTLTAKDCESLNNLCLNTKSSFSYIEIISVYCSTDQIVSLVKASKASKLRLCFITVSSEFLASAAVKNLEGLSVACAANDEEMLSLKMPTFSLRETCVSSVGINTLLKELLKQERNLENIEICNRTKFDRDMVFRGISIAKEWMCNLRGAMYIIDINGTFFSVNLNGRTFRIRRSVND